MDHLKLFRVGDLVTGQRGKWVGVVIGRCRKLDARAELLEIYRVSIRGNAETMLRGAGDLYIVGSPEQKYAHSEYCKWVKR